MKKSLLLIFMGLMLLSPMSVFAIIAEGTCGTCKWIINDSGKLIISPIDGKEGTLDDWTAGKEEIREHIRENSGSSYVAHLLPDWSRDGNKEKIKKVSVLGKVHAKTCFAMFYKTAATEIDLANLDTKNVNDMAYMFYNCSNLTKLNLGNLNTRNVTTATYMFGFCRSLPSLEVGSFDTSKMTDMSDMFYCCESLTELNLSNFNTEKVVTMSHMFSNCCSLTNLDISSFNTLQVQLMDGMFNNCKSFTELDLTNFNTTNVIDMRAMFYRCEALKSIDVSSFNTSNVTYFGSMFHLCSSLESIDLGNFNTANATALNFMFSNCLSLTGIDLGNFETRKVDDMSGMFDNCKELKSIDLNNFNTENVTNMSYLFRNCSKLTSIELGNFNTSKVTDMQSMFQNCSGLTSIELGSFNASKVTTMTSMFENCSGLTSLDLSSFNTSSLKSATNMFRNCTALETLDLTNFSCTGSSPKAFENCHATIMSSAVTPSSLHKDFFKDYVVDRPYCLQVPKESASDYLKADGWKTIMPRVLSDNQSRLLLTKYAKYMLGYERKVSGKYATFCLPFDLDIKQWLEESGGSSKLYGFASKGDYNESTGTISIFVSKSLTNGIMNAGKPFLVEVADGVDEITFFSNNAECDFSVDLPTAGKQNVSTAYGVVTMVLGNLFQKQENLDKNLYRAFNSDGDFGPTTWVNIFRAYVYKDDTNSKAKADKVVLAFEDGTTTSIDMIDGVDLVNDDAPAYNVVGQRVNGQAKGLMIKNGKKVMVK